MCVLAAATPLQAATESAAGVRGEIEDQQSAGCSELGVQDCLGDLLAGDCSACSSRSTEDVRIGRNDPAAGRSRIHSDQILLNADLSRIVQALLSWASRTAWGTCRPQKSWQPARLAALKMCISLAATPLQAGTESAAGMDRVMKSGVCRLL